VDEKALGRRLQLARKRAGLTQQELCQKAGLSYSTLAKIERGAIRSPSAFTVAHIAAATGSRLDDLLDAGGQVMGAPPEPAKKRSKIERGAIRSPSAFTVAHIAAATGSRLEDLLDMAGGQVMGAAPEQAKKRSKNGVRFVYFDVHGTLVRYYQRAFTDAGEELGVPADRVETSFWRHNDDICSGAMNFEQFNSAIAAELNVPSFDWRKYYMSNIEPIPGVADLVHWVAGNYEIGILSNNMPGFIDELRSREVIPKADYKVIIDSSVLHMVKPGPKIYEKAIELAAMQPNEILLIDDTRPFLTAADRTGMQIQWFNDLEPEDSISRVKQALAF
jgi:transcriptional regulator with XRE-family HTH domain